MDKDLWNSDICFYESYKPNLTCPTCEKGLLTLYKDNIKYHETKASLTNRDDEHFEYEEIKYIFAAILICNNPNCKETVSTSGTGGVQTDYNHDENYGYTEEHINYFYPKYFSPILKIIPIRKGYPDIIQKLLLDSFALFFADLPSCANKIRQIVEELLTIKEIPRFQRTKSHKLKFIPLEKRIELFKLRFPSYKDVADNFLAIKFIGNIGSHSSDVNKTQIVDAYVILQDSLHELHISKEEKATVKRLAKKIIKKKGR